MAHLMGRQQNVADDDGAAIRRPTNRLPEGFPQLYIKDADDLKLLSAICPLGRVDSCKIADLKKVRSAGVIQR